MKKAHSKVDLAVVQVTWRSLDGKCLTISIQVVEFVLGSSIADSAPESKSFPIHEEGGPDQPPGPVVGWLINCLLPSGRTAWRAVGLTSWLKRSNATPAHSLHFFALRAPAESQAAPSCSTSPPGEAEAEVIGLTVRLLPPADTATEGAPAPAAAPPLAAAAAAAQARGSAVEPSREATALAGRTARMPGRHRSVAAALPAPRHGSPAAAASKVRAASSEQEDESDHEGGAGVSSTATTSQRPSQHAPALASLRYLSQARQLSARAVALQGFPAFMHFTHPVKGYYKGSVSLCTRTAEGAGLQEHTVKVASDGVTVTLLALGDLIGILGLGFSSRTAWLVSQPDGRMVLQSGRPQVQLGATAQPSAQQASAGPAAVTLRLTLVGKDGKAVVEKADSKVGVAVVQVNWRCLDGKCLTISIQVVKFVLGSSIANSAPGSTSFPIHEERGPDQPPGLIVGRLINCLLPGGGTAWRAVGLTSWLKRSNATPAHSLYFSALRAPAESQAAPSCSSSPPGEAEVLGLTVRLFPPADTATEGAPAPATAPPLTAAAAARTGEGALEPTREAAALAWGTARMPQRDRRVAAAPTRPRRSGPAAAASDVETESTEEEEELEDADGAGVSSAAAGRPSPHAAAVVELRYQPRTRQLSARAVALQGIPAFMHFTRPAKWYYKGSVSLCTRTAEGTGLQEHTVEVASDGVTVTLHGLEGIPDSLGLGRNSITTWLVLQLDGRMVLRSERPDVQPGVAGQLSKRQAPQMSSAVGRSAAACPSGAAPSGAADVAATGSPEAFTSVPGPAFGPGELQRSEEGPGRVQAGSSGSGEEVVARSAGPTPSNGAAEGDPAAAVGVEAGPSRQGAAASAGGLVGDPPADGGDAGGGDRGGAVRAGGVGGRLHLDDDGRQQGGGGAGWPVFTLVAHTHTLSGKAAIVAAFPQQCQQGGGSAVLHVWAEGGEMLEFNVKVHVGPSIVLLVGAVSLTRHLGLRNGEKLRLTLVREEGKAVVEKEAPAAAVAGTETAPSRRGAISAGGTQREGSGRAVTPAPLGCSGQRGAASDVDRAGTQKDAEEDEGGAGVSSAAAGRPSPHAAAVVELRYQPRTRQLSARAAELRGITAFTHFTHPVKGYYKGSVSLCTRTAEGTGLQEQTVEVASDGVTVTLHGLEGIPDSLGLGSSSRTAWLVLQLDGRMVLQSERSKQQDQPAGVAPAAGTAGLPPPPHHLTEQVSPAATGAGSSGPSSAAKSAARTGVTGGLTASGGRGTECGPSGQQEPQQQLEQGPDQQRLQQVGSALPDEEVAAPNNRVLMPGNGSAEGASKAAAATAATTAPAASGAEEGRCLQAGLADSGGTPTATAAADALAAVAAALAAVESLAASVRSAATAAPMTAATVDSLTEMTVFDAQLAAAMDAPAAVAASTTGAAVGTPMAAAFVEAQAAVAAPAAAAADPCSFDSPELPVEPDGPAVSDRVRSPLASTAGAGARAAEGVTVQGPACAAAGHALLPGPVAVPAAPLTSPPGAAVGGAHPGVAAGLVTVSDRAWMDVVGVALNLAGAAPQELQQLMGELQRLQTDAWCLQHLQERELPRSHRPQKRRRVSEQPLQRQPLAQQGPQPPPPPAADGDALSVGPALAVGTGPAAAPFDAVSAVAVPAAAADRVVEPEPGAVGPHLLPGQLSVDVGAVAAAGGSTLRRQRSYSPGRAPRDPRRARPRREDPLAADGSLHLEEGGGGAGTFEGLERRG